MIQPEEFFNPENLRRIQSKADAALTDDC